MGKDHSGDLGPGHHRICGDPLRPAAVRTRLWARAFCLLFWGAVLPSPPAWQEQPPSPIVQGTRPHCGGSQRV